MLVVPTAHLAVPPFWKAGLPHTKVSGEIKYSAPLGAIVCRREQFSVIIRWGSRVGVKGVLREGETGAAITTGNVTFYPECNACGLVAMHARSN